MTDRVWRLWRHRLRPFWRDARPIVVVVAGLAVIVLGTIGYVELNELHGDDPNFSTLDAFYRAIGLFGLTGAVEPPVPWELQVARLLGPLVFGYAALQALLALFRQEARLLAIRLFARDHVVVVGLGDKGFRVATALHDDGQRVIVVDRDEANPRITGVRERGITVLTGDATDPEMLRRAQAGRAAHLVAVAAEDATNVDVAAAAERLAAERHGGVLTALVHLEDERLWAMLTTASVGTETPTFRLEFLNVFALGARALLDRHPPFAAGGGAPRRPHVLVAGFDGVGPHLVLQVVRAWRASSPASDEALRVTVAGDGAGAFVAGLHDEHPELGELCDLVAGPEAADVDEPATVTYVCLADEAAALSAALALRAGAGREGPVVVAVADDESGVARALRAEGRALDGIASFGVLGNALTPDVLRHADTELLARAKHDEYVRAEARRGPLDPANPSTGPWDRLPAALKESNRRFADGISAKLAGAGCVVVPAPLADPADPGFAFTDDEVEQMAVQEHDRWVADLRRDGWRPTDGPKDPERRLHPLLVTWEELSEDDRDRDRDPVREIPAMLARAGFRIVRSAAPAGTGVSPGSATARAR